MKCRDFEELLSAYADGELAQTQRDFIGEHLAGCADCRATLARYQETGNRLSSLRTTPRTADIKEPIMSRVKSLPVKSRRWLRPVLAGAGAVIAALTLTAVFVLPIRSPKDALARALASTQALRSYRFDTVGETRPAGTTEWIETGYNQIEYGGPGTLHVKSRQMLKVTATSPRWVSREWINSDNTVYLWDLTESTVSAELMNELWGQQVAQIEDPMGAFDMLARVKRLPDEKVDDVLCLHYWGLVDIDKYVAQQLPIMERVEREQYERLWKVLPPADNSTYEKDLARSMEVLAAYLRKYDYRVDYWIGKNDGLLHQLANLNTQAAWAHEAMPLSTDHRGTTKFYDFNADIAIKPPLDEKGNLLEGWRIQEK